VFLTCLHLLDQGQVTTRKRIPALSNASLQHGRYSESWAVRAAHPFRSSHALVTKHAYTQQKSTQPRLACTDDTCRNIPPPCVPSSCIQYSHSFSLHDQDMRCVYAVPVQLSRLTTGEPQTLSTNSARAESVSHSVMFFQSWSERDLINPTAAVCYLVRFQWDPAMAGCIAWRGGKPATRLAGGDWWGVLVRGLDGLASKN